LHMGRIAGRQWLGEPVDLLEAHRMAEQLRVTPDHDLAGLGADRHDVHRLGEAAGEPAALADGVAREAVVLADDVAPTVTSGPGASAGASSGRWRSRTVA